MSEAIIIGDEKFIEKMASAGKPKQVDPALEHLAVSINPQGELVGDTSHLPEEILAQLQTPQSMQQMRDQYRASRYGEEPARPLRWLNEREDRRIFADRRPPNMTAREWRHKCRIAFRKTTKAVLKVKRSMDNGG